jgi:NAD(P)H-dependent flavin oxidoreductase YrpB (nitropropane dioxygenase family)
MTPLTPNSFARRRFLEFLATSPYVAACGGVAAYLENAFAQGAPDLNGGRSTETGRATIEALPEVVTAVGGHIPVVVDGGFRRGTDVFKALALGAKAVGIGRPMLWGLGAFG